VRNLGQDLHRASDTALTAGQPNGSVTAASAAHRGQIVQLPDRELDIYGNQLARCLKAPGPTLRSALIFSANSSRYARAWENYPQSRRPWPAPAQARPGLAEPGPPGQANSLAELMI
jgi:hypothetical protein